MIQNVFLIELDNSSADGHNIITQLQHVVSTINIFTNADQCIDFLTDNSNEKIVLIISDALCEKVVPLIHDIVQLDTIFIVCKNKTRSEQLAKGWSKIKGVVTESTQICEVVKHVACQSEQNLDHLDFSLISIQILKEILLSIKFEKQRIQKFIDHCRNIFVMNEDPPIKVNQFTRKHRHETPISLYTDEDIIHSMLNHVLQILNVDIILKMISVSDDLHHHIEQLHHAPFNEHYSNATLTVSREQGLCKTDLEQMKKTSGKLITSNSFLSISRDQHDSVIFSESNLSDPDLVRILFVMKTDSFKSITYFASIIDVSYF